MKRPSRVARVFIAMAAAVLPLAPAVFFAGGAQAKSVECDEAGNCVTRCTQKLPDGAVVEYDEGTNITITTTDGKVTKFTCKNGQWVQTANTVPVPGFDKRKLIGNIGVGSVGGIQGDLTTQVCNFDNICFSSDPIRVGPPGLATTP